MNDTTRAALGIVGVLLTVAFGFMLGYETGSYDATHEAINAYKTSQPIKLGDFSYTLELVDKGKETNIIKGSK